ncbi:hypothetical protein BVRB_6g140810 isoform B [Beta vulgaris subsp. vulgaris]|uniref:uncharacterized protein LOC104896322 isoform X1 n=1 Tax=Beta vulgaris subsp. vulgaris TaxID=3555 RepID=UPI00053F7E37|nr:uncharacterized protein LOC104896322 isoform X1 [Beta vulgaris subsp. vulgaris]KMT08404.1 hypothetical protein BVRB_6g140810 isoform B [Beta vulgaris subsp. vulgaris]
MEDSNRSSRLTWEGCSVLLDINDGERLVFARLSAAATLKIGKTNFSLQPLVGCPFGSLFRVENGKDKPYLSRALPTEERGGEGNDIEEKNVTGEEPKDNRALVDNNTAQSLTGDDIDEMRSQGATGDQIVEALIANSTTFEKKTSFSQEKYRLRKQKKYAPKVLVRRPFVRSICDAYFRKYPAKIGCLRSDALSLLLSMANVTAYSDVLVLDMVGGMVTGAVAERLGGTGYVCNVNLGVTPYPMDIVRIFNFNNDICKRIVRCCLNDLCSRQNGGDAQVQNMQATDSANELDVVDEEASLKENRTSDDALSKTANRDPTTCKPIKAGEVASEELINSWKEKGFSSLIIAAQELDVGSLIQKLLPHLSYSASFAIYHQYLQPLAACMHNLQREKMAIGMQISEPWLREYQVLPSRTHPHMQMSAFGGYILSGTKICTSESNVQ